MTMMASAPSQQPAAQTTPGDLFRGFSSISNRVRPLLHPQPTN